MVQDSGEHFIFSGKNSTIRVFERRVEPHFTIGWETEECFMKNCVLTRECFYVHGWVMRAITIAAFTTMVFASCVTVTPDMLRPEPVQNEQRVLPLEFVDESAEVAVAGAPRSAVFQSDFYTIFDRELRQNLYIPGEVPAGTIDIAVTFYDQRSSALGIGLQFVSGLTVFAAPLLGMPYVHGRVTYEIEVTVRDSDRAELWNQTFGHEETGLLWIYNYGDGMRQAHIRAFHALAQDVRIALSADAQVLNRQLRPEM